MALLKYRYLLYFCTAISGGVSLIYQVVWQRYLSILVGSEARSLSLVIAIFLLGLASGYYVFGRLTEKNWHRNKLLKIYGYVEFGIAIYAILFPQFFSLLKTISFNGPALFLFDIFITCVALLIPTFLMGASIPMLTMAIPEKPEEVNTCHAKVYGWNTFGAFAGTLGAGFILVPQLGLPLTMYLAGCLNLLIAFVFLINPLNGFAHKSKDLINIKTLAPGWFYTALVFVSGVVIISLETSLVRVLNLSIGSGIYNFPIILSIFILGLALGSLCLKNLSVKHLVSRLFISIILLAALNFTAPYWSIWINHIRVSIKTIETNYVVYFSAVYVFIFLFLFPPIFFLGQLLPLAYALIGKTKENYGRICGRLYFFNTVGTVVGAIVLGYWALYIIELDHLFKVGLVLLCVLFVIFTFYEKFKKCLIVALIFLIACVSLPGWDRAGHYVGYFRNRNVVNEIHFRGLFSLVRNPPAGDVRFFQDGPNSSVSLIQYDEGDTSSYQMQQLLSWGYPGKSYSIIVNGKSDSNVQGDFSTLFLLPVLPVLFFPVGYGEELLTSVVGLGTGVSAGLTGHLNVVKEVTVLEISPKVVEAVSKMGEVNFNVTSNPKVKIKEQDAFKFFTRNKQKMDIIISEPTNPWVTGVENLFTVDFYKLAKNSLSENGILSQWMHLYSMDQKTFKLAISAIREVFEHVQIYQVGMDVILLASLKPLKNEVLERNMRRNFYFTPLLKSMGLKTVEDIYFSKGFSDRILTLAGHANTLGTHSLETPRLSYLALKDFFMAAQTTLSTILPEHIQRAFSRESETLAAFERYKNMNHSEISNYCFYEVNFFCEKIRHALQHWRTFSKHYNMREREKSYSFLRRRGYIEKDPIFIRSIRENAQKEIRKTRSSQKVANYIKSMVFDGNFAIARTDLRSFRQYLNDKDYEQLKGNIQSAEKAIREGVQTLSGI